MRADFADTGAGAGTGGKGFFAMMVCLLVTRVFATDTSVLGSGAIGALAAATATEFVFETIGVGVAVKPRTEREVPLLPAAVLDTAEFEIAGRSATTALVFEVNFVDVSLAVTNFAGDEGAASLADFDLVTGFVIKAGFVTSVGFAERDFTDDAFVAAVAVEVGLLGEATFDATTAFAAVAFDGLGVALADAVLPVGFGNFFGFVFAI